MFVAQAGEGKVRAVRALTANKEGSPLQALAKEWREERSSKKRLEHLGTNYLKTIGVLLGNLFLHTIQSHVLVFRFLGIWDPAGGTDSE